MSAGNMIHTHSIITFQYEKARLDVTVESSHPDLKMLFLKPVAEAHSLLLQTGESATQVLRMLELLTGRPEATIRYMLKKYKNLLAEHR